MKASKGFTLIEFILYFGLLAIIITTVMMFAVEISKSRSKAAAVSEVEQNVRLVMLRVLRAVRQANKLNAGTSTFDSDNGVLSLDQPATSTTPTVFDLSGGAVRIKEGAGAATPLTSSLVNVTKLRFSKDSLGGNDVAVTVEIAVQSLASDPAAEFNYATTASSTAVIRKP